MMRHTRVFVSIYFLISLLALISCGKDQVRPEDYYDYQVSEIPLTELMNMDRSRFRSRREQADYALSVSKALDDRLFDVTSDSLIAPAVRYYQHHGPKKKQMLAAYYYGRVLCNMENVPEAETAFKRAEKFARQLNDDFYLGLIYRNFSMLSEYSYDTEKTVDYIRKAVDCFHRAGTRDYENYERIALATALGNNGEHQASRTLFDSLLNEGSLNPYQLQELQTAYEREMEPSTAEPREQFFRMNIRKAFSKEVQEITTSVVMPTPSATRLEKESKLHRWRLTILICMGLLLIGLILVIVRRRLELREAMAHVEAIQQSLDLATEKNTLLANSIMRDQIDALKLLSDEYDQSTNAATREHYFLVFKKRLGEFRNQGSDLTMLESSVNEYREGAMALLRKEIPGQSTLFYRNAAMFFAGLPYDLMSLLTRSSIPALKSWKTILRKKMTDSDAPHKDIFLSLLDSAGRRTGGRPKKE